MLSWLTYISYSATHILIESKNSEVLTQPTRALMAKLCLKSRETETRLIRRTKNLYRRSLMRKKIVHTSAPQQQHISVAISLKFRQADTRLQNRHCNYLQGVNRCSHQRPLVPGHYRTQTKVPIPCDSLQADCIPQIGSLKRPQHLSLPCHSATCLHLCPLVVRYHLPRRRKMIRSRL